MNLSLVPNSDLENRRLPKKINWLFSTQALHVHMAPQTFKSDPKTLHSNAFNNGDPLRRRPRPHWAPNSEYDGNSKELRYMWDNYSIMKKQHWTASILS